VFFIPPGIFPEKHLLIIAPLNINRRCGVQRLPNLLSPCPSNASGPKIASSPVSK
jgi:hypothetical protein